MANIAVILSALSVLGTFVGLVSPKYGLYWFPGNRNRIQVLRIYFIVLALSFLVFAVTEKP